MNFYYGSWQLVFDPIIQEDSYASPIGTIGLIDLRSLPDQSDKLGNGFGLFATNATLSSDYKLLVAGNLLSTVSPGAKNLFRSALKIAGSLPDKLNELIFEVLTSQADPEGSGQMRPIMPGLGGALVYQIAGLVFAKSKADWMNKPVYANNVFKVYQNDYAKIKDASDLGQANKYLATVGRKLRINESDAVQNLVPAAHRADARFERPETTVSDNFNRADEFLKDSGTWTVTTLGSPGTELAIVSNRCNWNPRGSSNGNQFARFDTDMSSDDHEVTVDSVIINSNQAASAGISSAVVTPGVRFSSSANTLYKGGLSQANQSTTFNHVLQKVIAEVFTTFTFTSGITEAPLNIRVTANGSTIESFFNGGNKLSVTDTSITGNLRAGGYFQHSKNDPVSTPPTNTEFDNWQAQDCTTAHLLQMAKSVGLGSRGLIRFVGHWSRILTDAERTKVFTGQQPKGL